MGGLLLHTVDHLTRRYFSVNTLYILKILQQPLTGELWSTHKCLVSYFADWKSGAKLKSWLPACPFYEVQEFTQVTKGQSRVDVHLISLLISCQICWLDSSTQIRGSEKIKRDKLNWFYMEAARPPKKRVYGRICNHLWKLIIFYWLFVEKLDPPYFFVLPLWTVYVSCCCAEEFWGGLWLNFLHQSKRCDLMHVLIVPPLPAALTESISEL